MTTFELTDETVSAFHLFWDRFPSPVLIIHKDRTILAANRKAEEYGIKTGTRCIDLGTKEQHKGCLANPALKEAVTKRSVNYVDLSQSVIDSYWVPLEGRDDVYLHFSVDISEYASDKCFPQLAERSRMDCCPGVN